MLKKKLAQIKKAITREKVFDAIFLSLLCIVYSIVAFTNLGDDTAPQTFFRLQSEEKLAIVLDEPVASPNLMFYVGISRNDFDISFARVDNYDPTKNQGLISEEEISSYWIKNIDGPFRWKLNKLPGKQNVIIINNNASGRFIDFGEIAVFSDDTRVGAKFYRFDSGILDNSDETLSNLDDERDIVPKEQTFMNSSYFDELYFAQTAYQYSTEQLGYETVHPPLGKLLQSIPITITGRMTPFTWRFMGTFVGVLIIIATYFLALEIFKKPSFARVAAILVSLSGLHFVQTRVGTVDSHLCLFTILAFLSMMKFLNSDGKFRYFILSGVFYGCAFTVKWSGAFCGVGLALMLFSYLAKTKQWDFKNTIFKNLISKDIRKWIRRGSLCFILIPGIIYCSCYLLFPKTTDAHSMNDVSIQSMHLFRYHKGELTPHPYSSKWYTWPIALKPMLYAYDNTNNKSIYLTGNYAIAYVSIIGLLITLYMAYKKRDIVNSVIIGAWLGLWLPYALIERTMFLYHYLPASIFAILALVNIFYQVPKIRSILPYYLIAALISFIIIYPNMVGL